MRKITATLLAILIVSTSICSVMALTPPEQEILTITFVGAKVGDSNKAYYIMRRPGVERPAVVEQFLVDMENAVDVNGRSVDWYFYVDGTWKKYDFGKHFEDNIRSAYSQQAYSQFIDYLKIGYTTLYAAAKGSRPVWNGYTGPLRIEYGHLPHPQVVGIHLPELPPSVVVNVVDGRIADFTSAQIMAMKEANDGMGPDYYATYIFQEYSFTDVTEKLIYNYNISLHDNVARVFNERSIQKVFTESLNPTIWIYHLSVEPYGNDDPVKNIKSQIAGAHMNSTTLRITETSGNNYSHRLQMAPAHNGPYAFQAMLTPSNRSHDISGLTTGEFYYFEAIPYSNDVKGIPSDILALRARPQRPATLSATPFSRGVRLNWGGVNDCDGYAVYMSTSINGTYELYTLVAGRNNLSSSVTGLASGRTYYFKVCAYKQVGAKKVPSVYSGLVTAKPL
ncbi:MAG: hypothetical protein FWG30_10210 [Eubacteriaceae bacterium]|nr:hypothetical protein [Eubacteriaceae bacterium]